jgi:predicted nucleotidyltransferase component of viral defense system
MNWDKRKESLVRVLDKILASGVLPSDSYLAGGTAVFLHLNHRISIDLDFFSPGAFTAIIVLERLKQEFKPVQIEIIEKDTLIAFLDDQQVKFSLFHFPFKLLEPVTQMKLSSGMHNRVASMTDLEAMKIVAIAQRGSIKDFIDLFYLINRTQHSIDDLIQSVLRKFEVDPNYVYHLKTALVYFADAEKEFNDVLMIDAHSRIEPLSLPEWEQIKRFFRKVVL